MADPKERVNPDFNPAPRVGLRPAATGSTVYVPPMQRDPGVAGLLAGLSKLEPQISAIIAKEQKEQNDEDFALGRKAALESALDEHEAIRQGKLAPQESKWFMKGYREQYGSILGDRFSTDILARWTESPEKDSDAAGEHLSKFLADEVRKITESVKDKDVLAGLLPKIESARGGIVAAQKKYTADRIIETKAELVGTEVMGIARSIGNGQSPEQALKALEQLDSVNVTRKGREGLGILPPDVFNEATVKAFIAVAKETPDYGRSTRILDTLQKHKFIGNNPKYAGAIADARNSARSYHQNQVAFGWQVEERNKRQAGDAVQTAFLDAAQAARGNMDAMRVRIGDKEMNGHEAARLLAKIDPDSVSSTLSAAKAWTDAQTVLDPSERFDLRMQILMSPNPFAAVREINKSRRVGAQDMDTFLADAKQRSDDKMLWDHSATQQALKDISEVSNVQRNGRMALSFQQQAELGQRFFMEVTAWREANPDATQAVIGLEVQKIKTRLVAEAEQVAKQRPTRAQPPAQQPKPAPAPQPAPAPKPAPAPQPAPNNTPTLTPEQRQKLREKLLQQ